MMTCCFSFSGASASSRADGVWQELDAALRLGAFSQLQVCVCASEIGREIEYVSV